MAMSSNPDRAGGGTPFDALATIAVMVLAVVVAPGLLAGIALGELLRRHRLAWSWTALTATLTAPVVVLFAPPAAGGVVDALHGAPGSLPGLPETCRLLWPFWLAIASPVGAVWKAWRDHRSRIQGGHAEQRATNQTRPLQWLQRRRRNATALTAGPMTADGVHLGVDEHGDVVRIPPLSAHATIVGGSDTGKTNTAEVLLEGHVADGAGFVVLDGKGGRSLARAALQLGAQYQRPVALWSVFDYGTGAEDLDALRLAWNVTGDGNPTEIKDRIASSEQQTEPYYAAVAARGLLMAARALQHTDGVVRLDELAACMESHQRLVEAVKHAASEDPASLHWAQTLGDTEKSGLRGMGLRLRTMVNSDGGQWLLPSTDGREINLYRAITEGWLVVFTLPQGMYPELIPNVTRYALQTINSVCTRIEGEGRKANAVVFVDELSAFDGDQLASTYERARSAGVRVIVATQSVSNFDSAGGTKLLDAALDNSELLIVHRQTVPDAAELLASVGGTEEAWEHTHQVQDGRGIGAMGLELGLDESGQRARRLTDRFRVHPNTIKQLRQGQAAVISKRPHHQVRVVNVRAGLTARPRP
jgi:conjugal transfer pilus assembly protein TraD